MQLVKKTITRKWVLVTLVGQTDPSSSLSIMYQVDKEPSI